MLVNVQVTSSPKLRLTTIVSGVDAVVGRVADQAGDREPGTAASVIENEPGVKSEKVTPSSTGSGRLSSSRLKSDRPSPVVVNAKSCGPFGDTSFTMVKVAWLCVFVYVQVTSAPADQIDVRVAGGDVDSAARRAPGRPVRAQPGRSKALEDVVFARKETDLRRAGEGSGRCRRRARTCPTTRRR